MIESFKVPARKRKVPDGKDGFKTRIPREAYEALVDMCNESTLSIKELAGRCIMYAYQNREYIREEDD